MQVKLPFRRKTAYELNREHTERRIQGALNGNLTRRQRLTLKTVKQLHALAGRVSKDTLAVVRKYQSRETLWNPAGYAEYLFLAEEERRAEEQMIVRQSRIWNRLKIVPRVRQVVRPLRPRVNLEQDEMSAEERAAFRRAYEDVPKSKARDEIVVDITHMAEFWAQQADRDDRPHHAGVLRGNQDVPMSELELKSQAAKRRADAKYRRKLERGTAQTGWVA